MDLSDTSASPRTASYDILCASCGIQEQVKLTPFNMCVSGRHVYRVLREYDNNEQERLRAQREGMHARESEENIKRLAQARNAAHPDAGGSHEAFLAAQHAYDMATDPEYAARVRCKLWRSQGI
jgi:hypothetical protein